MYKCRIEYLFFSFGRPGSYRRRHAFWLLQRAHGRRTGPGEQGRGGKGNPLGLLTL